MGVRHAIEDVLARDGVYVSTTSGTSMWPMLQHRRDTIVVAPPAGRLRRFDVALYRRGSSYVLHRVVRVLPDSYVILGDNCLNFEHGITDDQVIGVLTGFYRGHSEKPVNMDGLAYRAYVRVWYLLWPLRLAVGRLRRAVARAVRACGVVRDPLLDDGRDRGSDLGDDGL